MDKRKENRVKRCNGVNQAQIDYCSVGFNCQCFYFFYCGCFINLPRQDEKRDVSAETTGPAWAVAWADDQISAEHLVVLWLISKSSTSWID
ncbi:hypothetical protein V6N13_007743 [Hibiscus sabdariffa]